MREEGREGELENPKSSLAIHCFSPDTTFSLPKHWTDQLLGLKKLPIPNVDVLYFTQFLKILYYEEIQNFNRHLTRLLHRKRDPVYCDYHLKTNFNMNCRFETHFFTENK